MLAHRRFTAFGRLSGGVGLMLLLLAPAEASRAATATRLGAPYEAGGVWFVPAAQPNYDEEGLAAEYQGPVGGGRTFGGERFDPHALTAGHPTLPTDTAVEVTNLDTGKSIVVTINDRGPYAPGRLLNLSPAAARALGVPHGQSARVRVRYPGGAGHTMSSAASQPTTSFGVQVGAFAERARAEQVAGRLAVAGRPRITPLQRGGATLYRVTLPAGDAQAAAALRARVGDLGFSGATITSGL